MKLYYAPGACSLAPHIVLRELNLPFELVRVDLASRKTADGADYLAVNPHGYVPALELDGGDVLTEAAVILQYLADRKPAAALLEAPGTITRYHQLETLNFIAAEVHKALGGLFNPALPATARELVLATLGRRCDHLAARLRTTPYICGERFTVADAYLFTVLGWAPLLKVDLSAWPGLGEFSARIAARPAVQAALRAEGLVA